MSSEKLLGNLLTAGVSSLAFAATAAVAETANSAAVTTDAVAANADVAADVGELLVTARRREESAQAVPIAMTVLGGQTLAKTGAYNIALITQLAPSVQFGSFNPRNTTVNIRGLGNNLGLASDGLEAGVGLYIDQVYLSRPAATTFDLVDIERVEVLRGPQGTLFGKNTSAGALNVTTRSPSFTPQAEAEVSGGNLGFFQIKGSASGPIVPDRLAARLSVSYTRRDGLLDNVLTGTKANNQDNLAARGQILWKPADRVTLRLIGDYNRQRLDCCLLVFAGVGQTLKPAASQFAALAAGAGYAPPSLDPFARKTDANAPARANQDLGGVSLQADVDLGPATLTSITAWRYWRWDPANDADFTRLAIVEKSYNADRQNQYSQEIRLASNGRGRIDWVGGVYLFRQTIAAVGGSLYGADATYWLLSPALPSNLISGYAADFTARSSTNSYAVFGQAVWHVTDKLSLTPGLRYTYERKYGVFNQTVSGGLSTTNVTLLAYKAAIATAQAYSLRLADGSLSGQANFAYQATPDILIYGNFARGYKSGGLNLAGLPNSAPGVPALDRGVVAPETTNAYEAGLKSRLFDRRLIFNLALFRSDTTDYQANIVETVSGVLKQYVSNIPQVRSQGVEADLQLAQTHGLSANLSATYTDASYVDYPSGPCPLEKIGTATQVCDLSGKALPGVSKWALSVGGEYARPVSLGRADARAYFGFDYSWRSAFFSAAADSVYSRIGAYGLLNLRAGLRSADSRWDAFVWARNAADTHYFQYISGQVGNTGALFGNPGDPRTVGVTVRTRL